ncbi:MAG: MFS transporter [Acidimicrobiales bacterium]|nr:MFS transporter [Acidimicrobiales bacterium]
MSDPRGWRPLTPSTGRPGEAFEASPFTRLARAHALTVAGDTLVTLALANSLFFNIEPDAARWRVALYLLLTMAPFSVVSPLIGPAIDRARGGRRLMVVGSAALRAVICALMIGALDNLLLFPLAFLVLVLAKGYHVAKSALVPTTVSNDAELVEANSKLSVISGLMGFVAAVPGLLLLWLAGSEWLLGLAALVFGAATIVALQLPRTRVAEQPAGEAERVELRGASIVLASTAMALLRGIVGFLTFLIAFSFRNGDAPTWWFGAAVAASAVGSLLGALVAPRARRLAREEVILIGGLTATMVTGLVMSLGDGLGAACATALAVGLAAATGKLAFDAIVQRDAPDANRGRAFARFETRFQVSWVIGAFLPVVIPIPAPLGYLLIAVVAAAAGGTYLASLRRIRHLSAAEADELLRTRAAARRDRLAQGRSALARYRGRGRGRARAEVREPAGEAGPPEPVPEAPRLFETGPAPVPDPAADPPPPGRAGGGADDTTVQLGLPFEEPPSARSR